MGKYKYDIASTTKKERKKYAEEGEMCKLGGGKPSDFAKKLVAKYVNGELEAHAVKNAILAEYVNI